MTVPKDLEFTKQLILDNLNSEIKILASLQDQSPLISLKNVGKGKVILFHVTSNNEWSNLPLSSLFQDLISKLLLISRAEKDFSLKEMKIKYIITSSGELANPEKNYYLNYDTNEKILPSATQPIGIYENNNLSIALNLSGNLKTESFYNKINEKIKIKKKL